MNENLEMKASPLLVITRIIFLIVIALIVVCVFFGLVDMRSDAQKEADYRKEVLEKEFAGAAVEAINISQEKYPDAIIEKVSIVTGKNKVLVEVTAVNDVDQYVRTYYNTKQNTLVNEATYKDLYYSNMASSFYVGKNGDIETVFEGEELIILCEEARK